MLCIGCFDWPCILVSNCVPTCGLGEEGIHSANLQRRSCCAALGLCATDLCRSVPMSSQLHTADWVDADWWQL